MPAAARLGMAIQGDASVTSHIDTQSGFAETTLFRAVPSPAGGDLEAWAERRAVGAGEVLFEAGQRDGVGLYVVLKGRIGIFHAVSVDSSLLLAEIGPGGTFGGFSALSGGQDASMARALDAAEVAHVPDGSFAQALREEPALVINLMENMVEIVSGLDEELVRRAVDDQETSVLLRHPVRFTL